MSKIPQLKKKISSFLTKEDGKISKEKLVKTGVLLSAVAITSLKTVEAGWSHTNELSLSYSDPTVTGQHSNQSDYSHYAAHSSGGWC